MIRWIVSTSIPLKAVFAPLYQPFRVIRDVSTQRKSLIDELPMLRLLGVVWVSMGGHTSMLPNEKVWRWSTMTSRAPSGWQSAVSTLYRNLDESVRSASACLPGGEVSLNRVSGMTNRAPSVRFLNEKVEQLEHFLLKIWVSRC